MTRLAFSRESLLSPEQFRAVLREALSTANPVDDLLELAQALHVFEQQYGMPSSDFYLAYEQGQLAEPLQHQVAWAATYHMFVRLKRKVEATLMRAALEPMGADTA